MIAAVLCSFSHQLVKCCLECISFDSSDNHQYKCNPRWNCCSTYWQMFLYWLFYPYFEGFLNKLLCVSATCVAVPCALWKQLGLSRMCFVVKRFPSLPAFSDRSIPLIKYYRTSVVLFFFVNSGKVKTIVQA